MRFIKLSVVLSFLLFLFGCASGARMENMRLTESNDAVPSFDAKLEHQVRVGSVTGGKETNPAWISQISNDEFQQALKASLQSYGLYSDTGKYRLTAELVKVDQPLLGGLNPRVTTYINYQLEDSSSKDILFEKLITASHTATGDDTLYGVKRLRMANEGSGKENIKLLIQELSNLKIEKNQVSLN